jgi:hypothetical protein
MSFVEKLIKDGKQETTEPIGPPVRFLLRFRQERMPFIVSFFFSAFSFLE